MVQIPDNPISKLVHFSKEIAFIERIKPDKIKGCFRTEYVDDATFYIS